MQAEANVENLNKLQALLGLPPRPSLDELRKPPCLHTPKHLTAWFDEWVQLYELLPHIIHPDSVTAASDSSESTESADDDSSGGTSPESSDPAETTEGEGAATSTSAATTGDDVALGEGDGAGAGVAQRGKDGDGSGDKGRSGKGNEKGKEDGDQRVRLDAEQVKEVCTFAPFECIAL